MRPGHPGESQKQVKHDQFNHSEFIAELHITLGRRVNIDSEKRWLDQRKPEKESRRPTGNKYARWLLGREYHATKFLNQATSRFFHSQFVDLMVNKTNVSKKLTEWNTFHIIPHLSN